jgi:diazepam-binding inhibitor (GABA receptor modulating acyl-CoA-binding protein)
MDSPIGDPEDIQQRFDAAVSFIRDLPKEGPLQPSNEDKLRYYSLYKQSTEGANQTVKPGWYDLVGRVSVSNCSWAL